MMMSKPLCGFNGINGSNPSYIVSINVLYYPNPLVGRNNALPRIHPISCKDSRLWKYGYHWE